jgi:hypothetical protein
MKMEKCALRGCEEKPIGGFQEVINASSSTYPNATIDGMKIVWCKSHEGMFRPDVIGKRGRWITAKELDK